MMGFDSTPLMQWLWQTTWQTLLLMVAIGLITWMLRYRLSAQAKQMLWMLVFVRLAMPMLPGSPMSIFGLFPEKSQQINVLPILPMPAAEVAMPVALSQLNLTLPESSGLTLWHGLMSIWILGATIYFGRVLILTMRLSRRLHKTGQAPDDATRTIIESACREAEVRPPTIIITDLVDTPSLFGAIEPRLLLPTSALKQLDASGLRSVVLHELEHMGRRHLLADWVLTLIRAVHWFNPAAWWAHRQIRAARELICDQAVLARLDEQNSREYGHAMVTLAAGIGRQSSAIPLAAFAQGQSLLRQRIEAIVAGKRKYIFGLGMILAAVLFAVFMTGPQSPEPQAGAQTTQAIPQTPQAIIIPDVRAPSTREAIDRITVKAMAPAVASQLERKLPELKFDAVPFSDVIEFLRDVSSANIFVNWRELEKAGIDRNAPVSLRLRDVTFSKALQTILTDVGGGGAIKLGFSVDDNVLMISTAADLAPNVATSVYDVRDLINAVPNSTLAARQKLMDEIIALIQDTPNWNRHSIARELEGQLIISAPPLAQQEILRMLEQIRESRAIQIVVEAMILRLPTVAAPTTAQDKAIGKMESAWIMIPDDKEAQALWQKLPDDRVSRLMSPKMVLFNGQDGRISIGSADRDSLSMSVQPTTSSDRKYVTMTIGVEGTLSTQGGIEKLSGQRLTLSVPDTGTMLMKLKRTTADFKPIEDGMEAWIVIKPKIIVQREREENQPVPYIERLGGPK